MADLQVVIGSPAAAGNSPAMAAIVDNSPVEVTAVENNWAAVDNNPAVAEGTVGLDYWENY